MGHLAFSPRSLSDDQDVHSRRLFCVKTILTPSSRLHLDNIDETYHLASNCASDAAIHGDDRQGSYF